jgi:hypothetical protein
VWSTVRAILSDPRLSLTLLVLTAIHTNTTRRPYLWCGSESRPMLLVLFLCEKININTAAKF